MRSFFISVVLICLFIAKLPAQSCTGSLEFLTTNSAAHYPVSGGTQYYSSNGFTWESWVKLTAPFSTYSNALLRPIFSTIDPVAFEDICLSFGWSGGVGNVASTHLCFKVDGPNSSTGASSISCDYLPGGGFTLGTWYHVAATMDYVNQQSKLYVNGVLVDTKAVNSAPMTRVIPTQLSWDIASNPGYANPPLGGNMDEVRIWSLVRTPADIATYYNQCLSGNEPGLVSYFRCNQSSGTSATDASPNAYNGSLVNGATWSLQQPPLIGANCSIGCCPIIKASNDTTICPGSSAQLTSTSGFATYTWTPSTGLNNSNAQNPVASPSVSTIYIVSATYTASGTPCIASDTVKVFVNNSLSVAVQDYTVCNGQTINIVPVVAGGSGNYTYNWGNGYTNSFYTTAPHSDSVYTVMVTDATTGCATSFSTGSITVTPPLSVNVNGLAACATDSITLFANVTGGNGNYTYTWSPSNIHKNPLISAAPGSSTVYTVVVSDGCTVINASDTADVVITPAPLIPLPPAVSGCRPVCIDLSSVSYTGLTSWQWTFGDGTISNGQQPSHCYAGSGNYNISLSYTTNLGCVKTVTSNSIVTVFPQAQAAFGASTFTTDIFNADINFYNQSSQYSTSVWTFGDGGSSSSQNPSHSYVSLGTFPVTLVVQNSYGCIDSVTHEITILDIFTFYAPNTFSPNYDNTNDTFIPRGSGWDEASFKMVVYDRWGACVYSSADPTKGWDGMIKGEDAQEDVYAWKVELNDNLNKPHMYSGTITLIK